LAVLHPAAVMLLVIVAGMAISGVAAMALERVAYRPLLGGPRLIALISAIGASFFLQDGLRLFESLWRNTFYLNYPSLEFLDQTLPLTANLVIPMKSLLVIVTALLTLAGLYFFVNHTKLGTAIRAVAQDPDTASLMGVAVNRVIALTFFVGGALGGLAGVLFGIHYSLVNPYTGFVPGMKAFTAAVLGGIGNIPGAMLGGMMLGLLEAFAASYLSIITDGAFGAEYKDVVAFLVLIVILIFRPKGLLGEAVREGKA
jgi:branched-chain amino acid transport system permease protein